MTFFPWRGFALFVVLWTSVVAVVHITHPGPNFWLMPLGIVLGFLYGYGPMRVVDDTLRDWIG